MLRCEGIAFGYGGQDVLRGVTLGVAPGQVLGLAGPSGSGKSTLLRCLAGELVPREGTVGVERADGSRVPLREQVGLVRQLPEEQLFAGTVAEDVAFGPHNLGLDEAAVEERVDVALAAVGLGQERFGERNPFTLSGGEARRVAIAGILALRPGYLLLDEPTAGLDPREGARLLGLIGRLAAGGMGVVVVSHDLDALARVSTHAALMRNGILASVGTAAEVLGDARRVRACGLLPSAEVDLADRLRARGLAVPAGVLTARQIAEALGVRP